MTATADLMDTLEDFHDAAVYQLALATPPSTEAVVEMALELCKALKSATERIKLLASIDTMTGGRP
jgi:hypothetical protein